MKISNELKKFIIDNKELIDEGEFNTLYRKLNNHLDIYSAEDIGKFTTILYKAGIDPLKDMEHIPSYFLSFTDIKNFTIPKNILITHPSAFYKSNLEHIYLSNIGKLGVRTFDNCENLKEITLPPSLYSIEEECFGECKNLERVIFDTSIDFIPPNCFQGCKKLTSIDLSQGVFIIGEESFLGSNLKSITVGIFLQTINKYALPKTCTDIYYNGTKEQWKRVNIDSKIYPRTVHCANGDIEIRA